MKQKTNLQLTGIKLISMNSEILPHLLLDLRRYRVKFFSMKKFKDKINRQ